MNTIEIPGLVFDPGPHVYRFRGARVPSVTQILDVIDETWKIDPIVLRNAAERGVAVHRATELDDLGVLDIDDLDPILVPYLQGWRAFRREAGFQVVHSEARIYHEGMGYAGTFDRAGTFAGRPKDLDMIDIKSGVAWPSHGPQTAAYAEAFTKLTRERIRKRWCVYLRPDGRYRLIEQASAADWSTFLACLSIRQFRASRNAPDLLPIEAAHIEGIPR